jgi:hypothetical protein
MGVTSRRTKPTRSRRAAAPVHDPGDDFVLILSRLTDDIERFDSMITSQRRRLEEHLAKAATTEQQKIRRQRKRISTSAARIANRAQGALDQLRELKAVPRLHVVDGLGRSPNRRAEDQPA